MKPEKAQKQKRKMKWMILIKCIALIQQNIQYIKIPHYLQSFANIPVNFDAWYSNTI